MKFIKMHGCGNDGVFLDGLEQPRVLAMTEGEGFGAFVRRVCDRHVGIGADFVVVMSEASGREAIVGRATARMRIFNSDGGEAQMCSTGVRGVAKLLLEERISGDVVRILTGRGVIEVRARRGKGGFIDAATVSMGEPILAPERIPTKLNAGGRALRVALPEELSLVVERYASGADVEGFASCASMGNPHVVVWCGNAGAVELEKVGPVFESHPVFPERVNAHFVQVVSKSEVIARHWERGAGATLACGTGSSAIVVAGVLTGRLEKRVKVRVPGGVFDIEWERVGEEGGQVVLTGGIDEVFRGEVEE